MHGRRSRQGMRQKAYARSLQLHVSTKPALYKSMAKVSWSLARGTTGSSMKGAGFDSISLRALGNIDKTLTLSLPPCVFVLPPLMLSSATTISIPPATETIGEVWPITTQGTNTVYTTVTTTVIITIPEITTSIISFSNVEWDGNDPSVWFWSSVRPPPIYLTTTLGGEALTWTYDFGPFPPATDSTEPPSTWTPGSTLVRTSIKPSSGTAKPTCTSPSKCGEPCDDCPPAGRRGPKPLKLPCIGFGCWDIGPPGSGSGSGGGSGPGNCIGLGCINIGPPGGGGGSPGGGGDSLSSCATPTTVSDCVVQCVTSRPCTTDCFGIIGCDITRTTTTTNKANGTPAPGVEFDDDEDWGPDDMNFASMSALLPELQSMIYDQFSSDRSTGLPDLPTLPPTQVPSPTGGVCVSSTTWVEVGGPRGEATLTHTECASWTMPDPEPTDKPTEPDRNHGWVVISYSEVTLTQPIGGPSWVRSYNAHATTIDGHIDICEDDSIFKKTGSDVIADAKSPAQLGPFKAQGYDCEYTGTEGGVGTLKCNGLPDGKCERLEQDVVCSQSATAKSFISCRF
ncbi:hypothetical protein BKA67DRAFT_536121 [Truncatella angustata]|uniref:Uncharacterized protein n=1 Tax=Truncatella angustata TaxID=152316 RepID=A0A9P8ZXG5_9PEZI|nr:uncharacterized protein BKA67DRAFT_536121 [Truncatella angustata]KAH6654827.1 hypothetical protein BKA67DRAFT_536121 [Truncatella angustata]